MLGRIVYQRLRPAFRKAWTRDVDARVRELHEHLARVAAELSDLRQSHRRLTLAEWTARHAPLLASIDSRLDADAIRTHVIRAVNQATLCAEPTAHLVVDDVLPPEFYQTLREAIPPAEFFPDRDPVKRDLEMETLDSAPELTRRVWRFFDDVVVATILAPAILERLRAAVTERYAESGGPDFGTRAAAVPHRTVAGRIQLRRPGYHLRPHLDPRRVAITGLLYLAGPGDDPAYGTQLFRVNRPFVASGVKTFFPEDAGLTCESAVTVPFKANTLFTFVNARAAHGATLPIDAPLQERYAFQFYVKPDDGQLKRLLAALPEAERAAWGGLI